MNRRDLTALFALTLIVRLATAALIPRPGYMDAAYYAAGAVRLGQGGGFSEPFIWNYLDEPAGIPHPGFLYWMPLPSILGAPFAALFPGSFFALQLPFALLSALLPLVAYALAWQVTDRRRLAWAAGLLAVFSGFFFPYWTLPETFATFALFGSLALWLAGGWTRADRGARTDSGASSKGDRAANMGDGAKDAADSAGDRRDAPRGEVDRTGGASNQGQGHRYRADHGSDRPGEATGDTGDGGDGAANEGDRSGTGNPGRWLLVGVLVGLAHLTRADGILLLPIVALAPLLTHYVLRSTPHVSRFTFHGLRFTPRFSRTLLRQWLFLLLGYLLVTAPWFIRNLSVIGAPLSPAGTKTIWLTDYDDLFCYRCDLSPSSYLAWGWGNILRSKLSALWINAQRLLAEGGLVFLLPFALAGLYRLRRRLPFLLASLYLLVIYLAHSLVFTFPGWRGGFFHASAAGLPFLYAAGIEALDAAVRWISRRRRTWRYHQAQAVFAAAAVAAVVALSAYVAWQRIPAWRTADAVYEDVDRWLTRQGAADAAVMVNNPPAFWVHTHRSAIVIPNGGVETLLEVADRYHVRYLLLDHNRPKPLAGLHAGDVDNPRLRVLNTWSEGEIILYAVEP